MAAVAPLASTRDPFNNSFRQGVNALSRKPTSPALQDLGSGDAAAAPLARRHTVAGPLTSHRHVDASATPPHVRRPSDPPPGGAGGHVDPLATTRSLHHVQLENLATTKASRKVSLDVQGPGGADAVQNHSSNNARNSMNPAATAHTSSGGKANHGIQGNAKSTATAAQGDHGFAATTRPFRRAEPPARAQPAHPQQPQPNPPPPPAGGSNAAVSAWVRSVEPPPQENVVVAHPQAGWQRAQSPHTTSTPAQRRASEAANQPSPVPPHMASQKSLKHMRVAAAGGADPDSGREIWQFGSRAKSPPAAPTRQVQVQIPPQPAQPLAAHVALEGDYDTAPMPAPVHQLSKDFDPVERVADWSPMAPPPLPPREVDDAGRPRSNSFNGPLMFPTKTSVRPPLDKALWTLHGREREGVPNSRALPTTQPNIRGKGVVEGAARARNTRPETSGVRKMPSPMHPYFIAPQKAGGSGGSDAKPTAAPVPKQPGNRTPRMDGGPIGGLPQRQPNAFW